MPLLIAFAASLAAAHFGNLPLGEGLLLQCGVGIVAYVVATTVVEARNAIREGRHQPIIPSERVEQQELLERVTVWLRDNLAAYKLHIHQAFLFGSVVCDHYQTRDVDVCLVLDPNRNQRRAGDVLRNQLAVQFKKEFGHRLHLKFCAPHEASGFLEQAEKSVPLAVKRQERFSIPFFRRSRHRES